MDAREYAWAFDHPFAAVTAKDGSYAIVNAPAGVELQGAYGVEEAGRLNGKRGEPMKLTAGDNRKDFALKVR